MISASEFMKQMSASSKRIIMIVTLGLIIMIVMGMGTSARAAGNDEQNPETKTIKINYVLDGGTNSEHNKEEYEFTPNTTHKIYEAKKEGYMFTGWYLDPDFKKNFIDLVTYDQVNKVCPEWTEITLYAKFIKNCVSIYYGQYEYVESAIPTGDDFVFEPSKIQSGGDLELSYSSKRGYAPAGWMIGYRDVKDSIVDYTNVHWFDVAYPITQKTFSYSDMVSKLKEKGCNNTQYICLMVKWVPNSFTVKFDKNAEDAEGVMNSQTIKWESGTKLTPNAFKRKGYMFVNWSYDMVGYTATVEDNSDNLCRIIDKDGEEKTLRANWAPLEYTVTFDKNAKDATGTMENQQFIYGTAQNLTANAYERPGYEFIGWSLKPYTKVIQLRNGDYENKGLAKNITDYDKKVTLYAIWRPETYGIVIHDINNPEEVVFTAPYAEYDSDITVVPEDKNGYQAEGWKLAIDEESMEPLEEGTIMIPVEDIVKKDKYSPSEKNVYIQYGIIEYTIQYFGDGTDGLDNPVTYNVLSDDITINNPPSKAGYIFKGWSDERGSDPVTTYIIKKGSTGNKMLTAIWEEVVPEVNKDDTDKKSDDQNKDQKTGSDPKKDNADKGGNVIPGVGTISKDGKTLKSEDGKKYLVAEKVTAKELKTKQLIADKKTKGKYKITKLTKKKGKVVGGEVEYTAPYNKNCTLVSATNKVKIAGVTFKVTSMGKNACRNCKKLTKVVIGPEVRTIGAGAFNGCKKLGTVIINSKKLSRVGASSFKGIKAKAKIKVPKKKLTKYEKLIRKAGAPKKVSFKEGK
ncbi:MAG: InlB B-repeat-containing protein [Eubacterium sp.]|nr:InlB B-repeat-containing protein [Eubacterium sp.]